MKFNTFEVTGLYQIQVLIVLIETLQSDFEIATGVVRVFCELVSVVRIARRPQTQLGRRGVPISVVVIAVQKVVARF